MNIREEKEQNAKLINKHLPEPPALSKLSIFTESMWNINHQIVITVRNNKEISV